MVVISSFSCMAAKLRQEFTRRPLTWTVQAPHWPWSQPFFVPVSSALSRRQSNNVVRGSSCKLSTWPFTRNRTGMAPATVVSSVSGFFLAGNVCAEDMRGYVVAATPPAPSCHRAERRLTGPVKWDSSSSASNFFSSAMGDASSDLAKRSEATCRLRATALPVLAGLGRRFLQFNGCRNAAHWT